MEATLCAERTKSSAHVARRTDSGFQSATHSKPRTKEFPQANQMASSSKHIACYNLSYALLITPDELNYSSIVRVYLTMETAELGIDQSTLSGSRANVLLLTYMISSVYLL